MVFHNVSSAAHTPRDDKREAISDGLYFIETVYTLLETTKNPIVFFFSRVPLLSFSLSRLSFPFVFLFELSLFDIPFGFISF